MFPYLRGPTRPRPTFRPRLECLESRTLPSTFTLMVNPAADNAGAVAELKADIAAANADGQADTLNLFPGGVYTLTTVDNSLNGSDGLPDIASTLTINGQGATIQRSTTPGTPAFRLFDVSGALTLEDLTLQGGYSQGGGSGIGGGGLGAGGAIFNRGAVTLLGVTLTGNTAQGGSSDITGAGAAGGGLGGDGGGGGAGGNGVGEIHPPGIPGADQAANGGPGGNGEFGGGGGAGGVGYPLVGGVGGNGGNGGFGGGGGFPGGGAGTGGVPGAGGFGGGNTGGGGAGLGGAVFSMDGSLTIINSTLAGNFALGGAGGQGGAGDGGAVFNLNGAVAVFDSTLAANTVASGASSFTGLQSVSSDGGAVYNLAFGGGGAAFLTLANSILADSFGGTDLANNAGTVTATGPNLIRSTTATISGLAPLTGDPLLGPLQDNGGLSPTMALQPDSPAIDAGSNAVAQAAGLTTDQRGSGFPRILGAAVGLGAFETVSAFAGLTPQERFVQALYLDALGRAGSKAELDSWAVQFNEGLSQTDAQAAIARGIDQSWEGRDHLVKGWYETYLGRAAVGGEEDGWVGLLFQGQSEEQVLSQILASPEFYNRAQTLGDFGSADQNYVQALYRLLLGRTASDAEAASWVVTLPQQGRQGVAFGFLTSLEYRTDLVQSYYSVLLHRPSDPQGLAFWVGVGEDGLDLRIGFEESPEFFTNG